MRDILGISHSKSQFVLYHLKGGKKEYITYKTETEEQAEEILRKIEYFMVFE